jgi:hypothetical protein
MQTLLDPFEVPVRPVAPAERLVAPPAQTLPRQSSIEVEVDLEDDARVPSAPSPDSSGRLRCWCSED